MNNEELLNRLTELYEDWQPNDSDFLMESPETEEEIFEIDKVLEDDNYPVDKKIHDLYHFNIQWMPDEVEEADKAVMDDALQSVKNMQ